MIKDILDEEEKRNDDSNHDGGATDTAISGDTSGGNESETGATTGDERIEGTIQPIGEPSERDSELDIRQSDGTDSGNSEHSDGTSGGDSGSSSRGSSRGSSGTTRRDSRSSRGSGRDNRGHSNRADTGGTRRTDSSENQEPPLVVVEEPITPKPKSQGVPKEVKTRPTSQTAKSRSKTKAGDIEESDMVMFLEGVFSLLGSMLGSHWFISIDEAEQISTPLVKMLNKQNKKRKDKVNDMMLPMVLMTAIGSIIVPRLIIQSSEWKEKRHERKLAEQKRANTAGGQNLSGIKSRTDSGETSTGSRGMATEIARPTFSNEGSRHDVQESNKYVPSLPASLIGYSD